MISKEAALKNNDVSIDRWPDTKNLILKAMDEYAEHQCLFFQEYLSRYKTEEYARTQKMYKEAGGIVTHRTTSIKDIYKDFIELKAIPSESMEGVIYYFNTGVETNNLDKILLERQQSKNKQTNAG